MNTLLYIQIRNAVLLTMPQLPDKERDAIISTNNKNLEAYKGDYNSINWE